MFINYFGALNSTTKISTHGTVIQPYNIINCSTTILAGITFCLLDKKEEKNEITQYMYHVSGFVVLNLNDT